MDETGCKWVDGLLGRLTLEQKVGQLMVFGFMALPFQAVPSGTVSLPRRLD